MPGTDADDADAMQMMAVAVGMASSALEFVRLPAFHARFNYWASRVGVGPFSLAELEAADTLVTSLGAELFNQYDAMQGETEREERADAGRQGAAELHDDDRPGQDGGGVHRRARPPRRRQDHDAVRA